MNWKRLRAIINKEVKHLLRDTRMLVVLLLFPVFLLIIFGYAVNFDVSKITYSVYDLDKSNESRNLVRMFNSSDYFIQKSFITDDDEIKKQLDKKFVQFILVIPSGFSKNIATMKNISLQILIDGVDGNTASVIQAYTNAAAAAFSNKLNAEILARKGAKLFQPISLEPVFWYNPDLKSTRFLIPGLIAMILIVTAVLSVSLTLVREKEKGTIEQLNVSPVNVIELIFGKSLPYVVLSFIISIFILIVGYYLFDTEVKGSYLLLAVTTVIFLFASTSLGIFISTVADSQQVAFSIATFATLLPSVILSGFIFPISSMPFIVQLATNLTPAKFFVNILRAIILRGTGINTFVNDILYLLLFAFLFLILSIIIFRKDEKAKS